MVVGEAIVEHIMVFSSTTVVALPLVIITLAMLVLMMAIMVNLIRKEESHQSIHLTATRMPPEMTQEAGTIWHLFLSHIVSRDSHHRHVHMLLWITPPMTSLPLRIRGPSLQGGDAPRAPLGGRPRASGWGKAGLRSATAVKRV